jgi:drug/metabolite transporter (DMT)-like permease
METLRGVGIERVKATVWGAFFTAILGVLIVVGSRNLDHFDAALVGYTFAVLFATFAITYRYTMWLQRPPTAL